VRLLLSISAFVGAKETRTKLHEIFMTIIMGNEQALIEHLCEE
jgi:hypothetical protein